MRKMITKDALLSTVNVKTGDLNIRDNVVITVSNIGEDGVVIGISCYDQKVFQVVMKDHDFNELMFAMHMIALERGVLQ